MSTAKRKRGLCLGGELDVDRQSAWRRRQGERPRGASLPSSDSPGMRMSRRLSRRPIRAAALVRLAVGTVILLTAAPADPCRLPAPNGEGLLTPSPSRGGSGAGGHIPGGIPARLL